MNIYPIEDILRMKYEILAYVQMLQVRDLSKFWNILYIISNPNTKMRSGTSWSGRYGAERAGRGDRGWLSHFLLKSNFCQKKCMVRIIFLYTIKLRNKWIILALVEYILFKRYGLPKAYAYVTTNSIAE